MISLYNAYWVRQQDPAKSVFNIFKKLKPTKITWDLIIKENPWCVKISRGFGINIKELLIFENYRYMNEYNADLEKYNSNKLFLLRQAANRIETNEKIRAIYLNKN